MDAITIKRLLLQCIIGCKPAERIHKQPLIMTIRLDCDCRKAGHTDRIEDAAVNYDRLAHDVRRLATTSAFYLVEALAEQVARFCLEASPRISAVTVTVEKPEALDCAEAAAVTIQRTRDDLYATL